MSLEIWSTIASVGTFVVITATAIAAILQLQHLRAANMVASIQTFFHEYEGADLRDAFRFVRNELDSRLEDPAFRRELRDGQMDRAKHPEVSICNFFDQWGLYYRDGVINRESFMRANANLICIFWDRLEPVVALVADPTLGNRSFQQFEYLTINARRWIERHPDHDYPKGESRLPLVDRWAAQDRIQDPSG